MGRQPLVLQHSRALRYLTFFYLYIMQGVPAGFALTTIANYLVGRGVSSDRIGAFIATVGLPWIAQFIWGPFIDRYQYSAMGRRKHWIVFSQWGSLLVLMMLLLVHDPKEQIVQLSALFFVNSIFASIQVASVDAMAITIAPENERGRLNGYMRGGFLIGGAIGAAGLSVILHTSGFRAAASIELMIMLLFSAFFFFTRLEVGNKLLANFFKAPPPGQVVNPAFSRVFKKVIFGITRKKSRHYFAIVALVYFCASVFIRSYTFYLIHDLHWSDQSVSLVQGGWGSVLTFFGIIMAGMLSDRIGAAKMQVRVIWAVCLFLLLLNGLYPYWINHLFSGAGLLIWNLADPLLSVTIFPILMALCIKKVEGSQFTTYLALINLCDVVGSYVTGWSLRVLTAPILGASCGLILLLTLLWLWKTRNAAIPRPAALPAVVPPPAAPEFHHL